MAWLVKAEPAAAGQTDRAEEAPALVADGATADALLAEPCHLRLQVIAHEIELMLLVRVGRMARDLGGWCRENQPAVTGIDRWEGEHIAKEGAVRLGIAGIDDGMHPGDHGSLLIGRFEHTPLAWLNICRGRANAASREKPSMIPDIPG